MARLAATDEVQFLKIVKQNQVSSYS